MYCHGSAARKIPERTNTTRLSFRKAGNIAIKLLITACLLCHVGCANKPNSESANGLDDTPAFLHDILISGAGDNTTIKIIANKPLKYRLYDISEPPRGVIDLSPALLNPYANSLKINSPLVSQIDINKLDTDGRYFTRVIFKLKRPTVFSASQDPSNRNEILLTVAKTREIPPAVKEPAKGESAPKAVSPHPAQASGNNNPLTKLNSGETKVESHAEVVNSGIDKATTKTNAVPFEDKPADLALLPETDKNKQDKPVKPVQNGDMMTIYKLNVIRNGVEIVLSGVNNNFKFTELGNPARLVLDLFGAKNAVENSLVPVNRFGIKEIHLISYPEKVRIEFEASGKILPAYRVEVDKQRLKLLFVK
jgi:hypothetical protein